MQIWPASRDGPGAEAPIEPALRLAIIARTMFRPVRVVYPPEPGEGILCELYPARASAREMNQTVEWLVKCVEHPATRWEGTYELSPERVAREFVILRERVHGTNHSP